MLLRMITFLTGDNDNEADVLLFIGAAIIGAILGNILLTLRMNNRLMADVSNHLYDARRVAIAEAMRNAGGVSHKENPPDA